MFAHFSKSLHLFHISLAKSKEMSGGSKPLHSTVYWGFVVTVSLKWTASILGWNLWLCQPNKAKISSVLKLSVLLTSGTL